MSASRDASQHKKATKEEIKEFFQENEKLLTALKNAQKKLYKLQGNDAPNAKFIEMDNQLQGLINQFEQVKKAEKEATPENCDNLQEGLRSFKIIREFVEAAFKFDPSMFHPENHEFENATMKFIDEMMALKKDQEAKKELKAEIKQTNPASMWQSKSPAQEQPKEKQRKCTIM